MSQNITHQPKRQHGFSMLEVLIALAIGLTLIASAVTVFSSSQRSVELNSALTDIQDNARFALDTISRDLRMAGFQGCVDINSSAAKILADSAPTDDYFSTAVSSSIVLDSGDWNPPPPIGFTPPANRGKPRAGTHTLSVQFGSAATYTFQPMAAVDSDIVLDSADTGLAAGDLALISNCQVADIFTITSSENATLQHSANGNSDQRLSAPYGLAGLNNLSRIMRFEANIYFIGNTQRKNSAGDDIYSLYKQTLPYSDQRPPIEMVEGVANMRIRLGVRSPSENNNGALTYVNPEDVVAQPGQVEVVHVGLLMQSHDAVLESTDQTTYYLAGTALNAALAPVDARLSYAADRRMKLAFNSTVKIRNRR